MIEIPVRDEAGEPETLGEGLLPAIGQLRSRRVAFQVITIPQLRARHPCALQSDRQLSRSCTYLHPLNDHPELPDCYESGRWRSTKEGVLFACALSSQRAGIESGSKISKCRLIVVIIHFLSCGEDRSTFHSNEKRISTIIDVSFNDIPRLTSLGLHKALLVS
jgi:hypothetical protein